LADQISDGVLDEILRQDPYARVAVESLLTTGQVVVAGEVVEVDVEIVDDVVDDEVVIVEEVVVEVVPPETKNVCTLKSSLYIVTSLTPEPM